MHRITVNSRVSRFPKLVEFGSVFVKDDQFNDGFVKKVLWAFWSCFFLLPIVKRAFQTSQQAINLTKRWVLTPLIFLRQQDHWNFHLYLSGTIPCMLFSFGIKTKLFPTSPGFLCNFLGQYSQTCRSALADPLARFRWAGLGSGDLGSSKFQVLSYTKAGELNAKFRCHLRSLDVTLFVGVIHTNNSISTNSQVNGQAEFWWQILFWPVKWESWSVKRESWIR